MMAAFPLAEKTVLEMELTCSPPQSSAVRDPREKIESMRQKKQKVEKNRLKIFEN